VYVCVCIRMCINVIRSAVYVCVCIRMCINVIRSAVPRPAALRRTCIHLCMYVTTHGTGARYAGPATQNVRMYIHLHIRIYIFAIGGRYPGARDAEFDMARDAEFDMASHEVSEIEHYIRGRGSGGGGGGDGRGGGGQRLASGDADGQERSETGAKELRQADSKEFLSQSHTTKSQFLRAGEEEAYEIGALEEEEDTFDASPPPGSGGGPGRSVGGGGSLRDEFREVMQEMEQHSSALHRSSGGGSGVEEEEEAMDEMDLKYESMLLQLEHTQVKATGPGGHFTAQRAEMHKANAAVPSPTASPPSGGRGVAKLSKDIGNSFVNNNIPYTCCSAVWRKGSWEAQQGHGCCE
jgi:hypothetical protein